MSYLDYRVKHRQHQNERGEGKPEAPATGRQAGGSSPASSDASTQKASTSKASSSGSSFLDYKVNNRKKEVKANGYERYGTYTPAPQTQAPAPAQIQQSGIKNRANAFLMSAAERMQNQAPAYRPPEANDMTKRLAAEYLRADSKSIGSPDAGFRNTTAGETAAVMKQADQRRQEQQKERQRQEFVNALRNPNARIGGAIRPDVTGSQGNVDQYGRAVSPLAQRAEEEYFSQSPIDRAAYMVTAAADPDNPLNDKRKIVAQNYATMTNEEKGVYNYLYATKGPSAAEEYHNGLMDVINQRRGQEYYDQNLRDSSPLMKTAYSFGSGFGSGLEGIANLPNAMLGVENREARSPMEYTSGAIRSDENNSLPEQIAYDIASSTGNMAPGMIASALTGAPMLGSAVFAASAGGNAYAEALANGEPVNTSQMYAAQQFVDEEVTNWLLGGINAFGGGALRNLLANSPAGQAVSEAVDNVVKSETGRRLVKSLLSYLGDMAGEAQQEYLQFFTENFTKALLGMKDENGNPTQLNTNLLDPDALYAAALGALNAGLLNVPSGAARINQGVRTDVSGVADFAQELAETPREAYTTDAAYESAQELQKLAEEIGQKKNVTAADRLAYNEAMNEFMQTAQEADAEENVEGQIEAEERAALNEEAVKELSRGFGEEGARAFRDMAPDHAVNSYRDFTAYYNHIRFGTEVPADTRATLTAEQISAAMKAGAADANAAYPQETVRAANKAVSRVNLQNVKAGNVDTSGINYNGLTEGQKLRVDYAGALVSKAFGMDVRFVQSKAENGAYKGMNGSFQVINGRPTITLDVNAGMNLESDWTGDLTDIKTMLPVISHEVTHSLEKSNPELYRQLSNAVIQALAGSTTYTEGGTINEVIRAERNRMDRMEFDAGGNRTQHTDSDAIHEIVARACEDFLSGDEKAVQVFENLDADTKKTLWDHVKEVFDNIKEFFTQMLSSYKSDSKEAQAIRQNMEEYERIRGIWQEALNGGEYAVNPDITSTEFHDGIGENGINISSGSVQQMSERTYEEGGRKYLDNWLKRQVKSNKITEQDRTDIMRALDEMKRIMEDIRTEDGAEVDAYSRWADTRAKEDRYKDDSGKWQKAFTAIVNNGEYKMNIDFSTVCKKRTALNSVLNAMVTSGDLNFETLTASEVVELNNIIKEEGFEIACALCFVDSKRYRIGSWAESFCEGSGKDGKAEDRRYGWNEIVRSMVPEGSGLNIADFNFTNRAIENNDTNLLSDYKGKVDMTLINEIKKNFGKTTEAYRMADTLQKNPSMRKLLAPAEMISSAGLDLIKAQNKTLFKLINSHQGTAKPKLAFDNVAYNNDILKTQWTPGAALKVGGVRLQSFSDFQANMIFDYVQMVGEMQAKGLSCHSYTKEASFVAIFGKTGIKINMSLVPKSTTYTAEQVAKMSDSMREKLKATAGLDKDGNYIWEDETFPYEVAMHIQEDPEYAKNCGTIAVGVSDPHIRKLLADPRIQMVIPYHKSSINHVVAALRNIALYNDYTDFQNTRTLDGKKLDGVPDFDFYAYMYGLGDSVKAIKKDGSYDASGTNANIRKLHENWKNGKIYDGKTVANAYLDWCEKKGEFANREGEVYLPRFDQFAYNEDGTRNENYYKLLADFRLYDENGNPAPQQAVQSIYPDNVKDLIVNGYKFQDGDYHYENGGLKNATQVRDDLTRKTPEIIKRFKDFRERGYSEGEIAIMQQAGRTEVALEERMEELRNSRAQMSTRDTQEIDAEYQEALDANNEDWQLMLVDQAAYKAGYTVGAYHGSPFENIRIFNTRSQDTKKQAKQLLFGTHFTHNLEYAKIYARKAKNSKGTSRMTSKEGKIYKTYLDLGKSLDLRTARNITPVMEEYKLYEDAPAKYQRKFKPYTFSKYDTEQGLGSGQYITAATLENVLQVMSPKEATDFLVDHGYNSILYDADYSTVTSGSNRFTRDPSIIMLDPERIKSGDPVTYDDDGNIIPLSRRFNPNDSDIRYSMRDSEYMSAVESDDIDTADRLVEEAAKEAGYTVRAYHGTPTGGFTKFVLDNVINGRTFGDGVYFSSSKEAAENFTAVTGRTKGTINRMVYDTYLNLGDNVLTIDYDELRKRYPKSPSLVEYEVRDMIKKQGPEASAIVIKGVRDGLDVKTTDYIVKTSSQIKSAETVVRDDNGDIIPLSERFNSGNDDIRYSQRGVDMSEELAASREQMDERYLARIADVIAEKDAEIEKLKAKMDKAVGAEKEKAKERLEKLRKDKNDRIAYLEKSYKANLDWRIAEMQQKIDKMKDASAEERRNAKERLEKLRAQKNQKIEDILQKNREQRLKRREKRAMQELLRRARRLMGESRKGSPEFKAQVDALIGDLDLAAAGLRDNTRAKLEELRKQVEAQSKLDPDYAKYEAPKYAELLNRIDPSRRHIKDMSIDEITRLTEAIVALEHSKQTADREIKEGQGRLFGHYGKLAVEQQKMAKGINYKNEIGAQLGKYRLNMLNPVRGFALIDGYQKDGVFTYFGKQLNDGQTKAAQFRMEVEKMFHDIDQNKKLIDDFAKQNIEIETLEGTKKISKGMRIALYLHLQNLDNVKHIAFGGITIPNETLYKRGKYKEAYAAGETVHLSEWIPGALGENVLSEANRKNDAMAAAAIRKITDQMTPEEMEYAKIAQEFFNVKTKDAINEVSLELNGYEKATVDDYFPICTDKNYLASNYDGLVQNGTLEGVGFLKERIGSRLPIYLEDVSQVVLRQKNNTALYYGLAIPVRNFSKFYSYTGGERLERTVKKAVGNTWHQPGLDYIDHVLNDLQFGRQTQRTITDSLKSLYAGTTLNFNIGVSIKQSASYPFAASVIGWEPLIKAARHVVSKADREYMDSITPWGYMRRTGFSGTEMGEVAKQRTGIDNNRTIQKVKSTLDLIRRVDVKTTEVLFFAAEEYVKEHYPDLEVRGKAYNQKLAEVYNEVLQRTQPSYDVMQRNEFLRAQNDIAKIFGAFKTQTFNMGGEVLDAWGRWRAMSEYAKTDSSYKKAAKDAGKAFGNTVAATLAAQGMLVILTAAANAVLHKMKDYRDEKGEVTPESVAAKILKDFGTSFAGLTMGGSEVQDFALALLGDGKWYDIDYPGLTLMNDFASASVDFKNAITKAIDTGDKKDMQKASVKMAKLLMQMFKLKGVPTQNIYNIANAIYLWGTDIKNGEAGTFNAGEGLFGLQDTSPTKQQYAKQAVDAYRRGDIAKGDRAVSRTSKDALKKAMGNGDGKQEDAIMFFQEADLTDEVQRRLWEAAGWKLKNYEKIFHK